MANHNDTFVGCNVGTVNYVITSFILLFALPMQLLIAKILCVDAELGLPRHKIMLSLTASDSLQLCLAFCSLTTGEILSSSPNEEAACKIKETVNLFLGTITLAVSSLSIVFLSIERYISCIYSFYVHQMMTTKRLLLAICTIWAVALGLAILSVCIKEKSNRYSPSAMDSLIVQYSVVFIVIPSATIIIIIQLRLFIFSRSKLVQVNVVGAFGNRAELTSCRRRQLKITFIAGIVAIAYISCMFPLAVSFAYGLQRGNDISNTPAFIKILALLNTLANPLIYGIGMVDTRRLMWRNLTALKKFLLCQQN